MDKTYNDLMDIVNRSKRMDGGASEKSRPPRIIPVTTEEPKPTKVVEKTPAPSSFSTSNSGSKLSNLISRARAGVNGQQSTKPAQKEQVKLQLDKGKHTLPKVDTPKTTTKKSDNLKSSTTKPSNTKKTPAKIESSTTKDNTKTTKDTSKQIEKDASKIATKDSKSSSSKTSSTKPMLEEFMKKTQKPIKPATPNNEALDSAPEIPEIISENSVTSLAPGSKEDYTNTTETAETKTETSADSTISNIKNNNTSAINSESKPQTTITEPDTIVEIPEAPQPTIEKPIARNVDSTYEAQLYEAIHNSIHKGGTDISEYMSEDAVLYDDGFIKEDNAENSANNSENTNSREQQEYEKLFTGSLGSLSIDADHRSEETVRPTLEISGDLGTNRNNADSTFQINSGNSDLDTKIAEYYKNKQKLIDKYYQREFSGYYDNHKKQSTEDKPVDYEAIFNSSIMTRNEALGIETIEEKEPEPQVTAEETTVIDIAPVEFNPSIKEEEVVSTDEQNSSDPTTNSEVSNTEPEVVEPISNVSLDPEPIPENTTEGSNNIQDDLNDIPDSPEDVLGITEETPIAMPDEDSEPISTEINEDTPVSDIKPETPATDNLVDPSNIKNQSNTPVADSPVESSVINDESTRSSYNNPVETTVDKEQPDNEEQKDISEIDSTSDNNLEERIKSVLSDLLFSNSKNNTQEKVEDVKAVEEDYKSDEVENTKNTVKAKSLDSSNNARFAEAPSDEFMDIYNDSYPNTNSSSDRFAKQYAQNYQPINPTEISLNSPEGIVTDNNAAISGNSNKNIYNLSANNTTLDDFIATTHMGEGNVSPRDNKANIPNMNAQLPNTQYTVNYYNRDTDASVSKTEFYSEMARLQENLLNELKSNKTENVESYMDYITQKSNLDSKAETTVNDLITKFTTPNSDDQTTEDELSNTNTDPISSSNWQDLNDSASNQNFSSATQTAQIINEPVSNTTVDTATETKSEPVIEIKSEPVIETKSETIVDTSEFAEFNLLNKDVALNNEDLAYHEKKYEEKPAPQDNYFYMSPADKEKKSAVSDEYMSVYENNNNIKELGDINIFKNIVNATPSSEILKEQKTIDQSNNDKTNKDIETIYTLSGTQKRTITKENENMKVLYVTSECQPFVASGGLGDVAGSLPKAIAEKGNIDIRVILPLYGTIKDEYKDKFEYLGNFTVHLSWRQEYCGLFRYFSDGVTYYFVDNERYFKRDNLYGYYDDGERFAYFSKAVVESFPHLNFFPDIIHCNDWQTGLVSAYIKTGNWADYRYYKIRHIYTIHNVEYQGVFGMENLKDLFGIDPRFRNDIEYNGDINITKAAIQYSDKFTTVSNSYCDNLKQPYCSRGLHHIIIRNEYKLSGIINGIDYKFYNPATDKCILKNYDTLTLENKVLNKKLWQDEIGLPVDGDTPMIAIVSRLVGHKGLDLIVKILPELLTKDIQLVVVGTGEQKYVDLFKSLEIKYPTKVRAFVDGYSNELARLAYASSDIFLMPSKIEPCGLSQMVASRYGSVPIVREVGGLKDTIRDYGCAEGGNGYTFANYNPSDLEYQLNRALTDYENKPEWREKIKACMTHDFTWKKPSEEYIKLYKSLSNN